MRHCIAVRSWASSTSTCPKVRGSFDGVAAVGRRAAAVSPRERRRVGVALEAELVDDARRGVELLVAAPRTRRSFGRAASTGPSSASASSIERDVVFGPGHAGDVARRGGRWSAVLLGLGEHAVGGRPHERGEPEQVVDELGAGEHRPHAVERLLHLGPGAEARTQLGLPAFGRCFAAHERTRDADVERAVAVEQARDVGERARRRPGAGTRGPRRCLYFATSRSTKRCAKCGRCSLWRPRRRFTPSTIRIVSRATDAQLQPVEHQREVVAQAAARGP